MFTQTTISRVVEIAQAQTCHGARNIQPLRVCGWGTGVAHAERLAGEQAKNTIYGKQALNNPT